MLILRLVRLAGALLTAVIAFSCASPPSSTPMATSEHPTLKALPELEAGQGRIILYRRAKAEGPQHALTMIDSETTFDVLAGRFAHTDVWPGEHVVDVVLAKRNYANFTAGIGRQLEKRVHNHPLYGKPLILEIEAGETAYVEVTAAGIGVSGIGNQMVTGQPVGFGAGAASGQHFVTLTPSYHSANQVRGLRYRVLFPTLVHADAAAAQIALLRATECTADCDVPAKMAELATREWRGSRGANKASSASSKPGHGKATAESDADAVVGVPASPYFD